MKPSTPSNEFAYSTTFSNVGVNFLTFLAGASSGASFTGWANLNSANAASSASYCSFATRKAASSSSSLVFLARTSANASFLDLIAAEFLLF